MKLGSGQRQKTFEAHYIEKVDSGENSRGSEEPAGGGMPRAALN